MVATCKNAFKMGDAQEGSFSEKKVVIFSNMLIYTVSPRKKKKNNGFSLFFSYEVTFFIYVNEDFLFDK